jgi:hypothetical protein
LAIRCWQTSGSDALKSIDLLGLPEHPPALGKLLALLFYEAKHGGNTQGLAYGEIFERIATKRWSNPSVQMERMCARLEPLLPAHALVRSRQGRQGFLGLALPLRFELKLGAKVADELAMAQFLGFERPPALARTGTMPEGEFVLSMADVIAADLCIAVGAFDRGGEALRALHRRAIGRGHGALRLWATLHELRLLRLAEDWVALQSAALRLRRRARGRNATHAKTDTDTMLAAAEVSLGWFDYHRVRSEGAGSYQSVVTRLEPLSTLKTSAHNLWVQCERYNLLSLALRRMAVGETSEAEDRRAAWASRSLVYNQEAMQLASLGGNQLSLAAYMANRSLILADLASVGFAGHGADSNDKSAWVHSAQWLASSEELTRRLHGGAETMWSGPYMLTIARLARPTLAWSALHQAMATLSPWYAGLGAKNEIDAAMAMAKPAMDQMIDQALRTRAHGAGFERQLAVMCRELVDAAQDVGLDLKRQMKGQRLLDWARTAKPKEPQTPEILKQFLNMAG